MVHVSINGVLESIKYNVSNLEYSYVDYSMQNLEVHISTKRKEEVFNHRSSFSGEFCMCLEEML